MTLYYDDILKTSVSYMTIKMPKANFFYKTEIDKLKF